MTRVASVAFPNELKYWFPTRSLAAWEQARAAWEPYVFRAPDAPLARPRVVFPEKKKVLINDDFSKKELIAVFQELFADQRAGGDRRNSISCGECEARIPVGLDPEYPLALGDRFWDELRILPLFAL